MRMILNAEIEFVVIKIVVNESMNDQLKVKLAYELISEINMSKDKFIKDDNVQNKNCI